MCKFTSELAVAPVLFVATHGTVQVSLFSISNNYLLYNYREQTSAVLANIISNVCHY